jgi:succinate dehydrogenase / fumarate reductase cytochrome b subunit
MTTATSNETADRAAARTFLRQRLGTILALAPLGVWLVVHIWNNLFAFQGAEAWEKAVTHHPHPIAATITWIVVLLPLLYHTVWGIGRTFTSRPNLRYYGYFGNLRYAVQRLTALGLLLFLGAHLWLAFINPRAIQGHPERFADIAHEMRHHLPTLLVYLLGTLGAAYHLGNGLATAAMAFGFGPSAKSQKRLERFAIGFFLVLLAMSWAAIYALWDAGGATGTAT